MTPKMRWRDHFDVHPSADAFPRMSDDELTKLTADIETNGLRNPIVFIKRPKRGEKPMLCDGINRMDAMERAGVLGDGVTHGLLAPDEMTFIRESDDVVSYILSVNIHRRHLTKQQQAELIVVAVQAAELAERRAADKAKADLYIRRD